MKKSVLSDCLSLDAIIVLTVRFGSCSYKTPNTDHLMSVHVEYIPPKTDFETNSKPTPEGLSQLKFFLYYLRKILIQ